ncbi:reverse transcriptase domain-containing protein, partial [Tanacetum coccineum]
GQILADFIVERPEEDSLDTPIEVKEELPKPWILFTDGSSCADGFGAGLILTNLEGAELTYALRFRFEATNNEAEYEALIAGLRIAEEMGVRNLQANVDSRLVANQVNGTYTAKESDMIRYLEKVRALANELKEKLINEVEVLAVVEEEGNTWMTLIYEYLTEGTLPTETNKERAMQHKSQRFAMTNGVLYKKSFLEPWLRCVGPIQANYVLREIHEGSCRHVKTAKSIDLSQEIRPSKVKFLIVAIDYFTKWIEAKPVATITGNQVKKFVWDNIVCRFGLPGEIISDNGKQFRDNPFKDWEGIKARIDASSKNWMEEISHVLWAHRTMIKSSNEDTPFSLTYYTEEVIPAEIGMPTLRTAEVDMVQNDEASEINLDLLEERRE